ncbi:MAG: DNA recombination protein RmuC [Opitutales bacterium]|nr:DNA recombination protein RmuC [Opitutales bacterium]
MIEHIFLGILVITLICVYMRYSEQRANLARTEALLGTEREKHEQTERSFNEKLQLLESAEERLRESFKNLSANALKSNNESFITLAKSAFSSLTKEAESEFNIATKPIQESLKNFNEKVEKIEHQRQTSYFELSEQLKLINQTSQALKSETSDLVNVLRKPEVRGRWGEMQLKRTVELSGMTEHVDFEEQENVTSPDGQNLRPDMIIRLPNNRTIIVDSKTPLSFYLDALQRNTEQERAKILKLYAANIRKHIENLGSKNYWEQFQSSPEFVVLFLPGEKFFSDALKEDPNLIEFGVSKRVIPATPTTMIALLKAVAYGWKQDKIADEAKNIAAIGHELYKRMKTFLEHLEKIGKSLSTSVKSYNEACASLETRLIPQAKKFERLEPSLQPINNPYFIDTQPRQIHQEISPSQLEE